MPKQPYRYIVKIVYVSDTPRPTRLYLIYDLHDPMADKNPEEKVYQPNFILLGFEANLAALDEWFIEKGFSADRWRATEPEFAKQRKVQNLIDKAEHIT